MAPAVRTRLTGPDAGTDWDEDDIVETHHSNVRLEGPDSANPLTVSLTSAGSPLNQQSGLQNPPSEQLEMTNMSTSVRHLIAEEMPRQDRPQERRRDDSQFVLDVRESVIAASRGKTPQRGLKEKSTG